MRHFRYIGIIALWMLFCFTPFCFGADKISHVLILPFNIHAEKDLSFLQSGVQDMLFTRLTHEDKVIPLSKDSTNNALSKISPVTEKIAGNLGKKFKADYVVFGSLTVFGDSVSTDARVYDTAQKKTRLTFNDTGRKSGDIIAHINQFAAEVNQKIFEHSEKTASSVKAGKRKPEKESRKHPETLWTGHMEDTDDTRERKQDDSSSSLGRIWKSRSFKTEIHGIAIGDTDGDEKNEVAFMDDANVFVYRYNEGRFIRVGEIKSGTRYKLLSIDVADINENGLAEIFVTSLQKTNQSLRSFVLEWDGRRFQKIVQGASWYYRVIQQPGHQPVLMGQQRGIRKIFLGGVHQLKWSDGQYIAEEVQNIPIWANVFSFNYGKLADKKMTLAFSKKDNLRVINPDGEQEWESPETMGGTTLYLESPDEASASIGDYKDTTRVYLPQRILIADLNNDEKNEVIVGQNSDTSKRLLSRVRIFKSGHIECLAWDNLGLHRLWKTRDVSGHLSDYALGDIDNDGRDDLVFSVIQQTSSVIGKAKSFIASYDFK